MDKSTGRHLKFAISDRWMRLIIWVVLANCLHFLIWAVMPLGLGQAQAGDAIRRIQETDMGPWGLALLAPSMVATLTIALSSSLLGMALRERMVGVTGGLISPRSIQVFCELVSPALLAIGVAVIIGSRAARGIEFTLLERTFFFAGVASPASICWLMRMERFQGTTTLARIGISGMLVFSLALMVATALNASWALKVEPVGLLILGTTFWAVLLTQLLISIPLFINWLPGSTAWILLIVIATMTFHSSNPYRMPSEDAPIEYADKLDQRRYPSAERALFEWLKPRLPEEDTGQPIPIFLVSANGGGIRTGYWAARSMAVLNRMMNGAFSRHTFAYSGVSGGGLGIATFIDSSRRHPDDPGAVIAEIDAYFSKDLLSPVLGRMLIGDPLKYWWGLQSIRSRDQVFEERLHRTWHEVSGSSFLAEPILDALGTAANQRFPPPLITFNATIAETGGRLQIANYTERSGARSYFFRMSHVEVQSLSIVQAVHLSARFPGISPPASLQARQCVPDKADGPSSACHWVRRHWLTIVDGGYNDNSGLAPIISIYDILTRLREGAETPCLPKNEAEQERCAITNEHNRLLKRLRFHVVILNGNTLYAKDEQGRVYPQLDPFLAVSSEERAPKPMLDLMATVAALNNARSGREPDNWATMLTLMDRLPRDQNNAARDTNHIFAIDRSADDKLDDATDEIKAACGTIAGEKVEELLADVPLGWSLSARVTQGMRCATERAMFQRAKLYRRIAGQFVLKGGD